MRRRTIDTNEYGKNIQITLKLPEKILNSIDEALKNSNVNYTGRSHFIEEACKYYLNTKKCPKCGTLNIMDGTICSYCWNKLDSFKETAGILRVKFNIFTDILEELRQMRIEYGDTHNKIKWLIDKQKPDLKEYITSLISPLDSYCLRLFEKVDSILKNIDNSRLEYLDTTGRIIKELPDTTNCMELEYINIISILETLKGEFDSKLPVVSSITFTEVKDAINSIEGFTAKLTDLSDNFSVVGDVLRTLESEVDILINTSD